MNFANLLLAEWTKLRTIRRWMITLGFVALLTAGLSALAASGARTDVNEKRNFVTGPDGKPVADSLQFAHQPITGDATITVHVNSVTPLANPGGGSDAGMTPVPDTPWTGSAAGVMIKDGTEPGSSYVAVLLNPTQGVRMQADFAQDIAGSTGNTSRWLRLTRTGTAVTGYESADGRTWQKIGTMTPSHLAANAQAGFYVCSSDRQAWSRGMGSSSLAMRPGQAQATFDHPTLEPSTEPDAWQNSRIKMPHELAMEQATTKLDNRDGNSNGANGNGQNGGQGNDPNRRQSTTGDETRPGVPDGLTVSGGTYTLAGRGKVGPEPPMDDIVSMSLIGVIAGLLTLIPIGVLFATSEFRKAMIRTTFTTEPRRGRVLAAKVIVLGAVSYVLSLLSVAAAFLLAQPQLRKHGFAPPAFTPPALADPGVIRVFLLTALFMTAVAVFALGLGMYLRHSAAAITTTVVLFVAPLIAGLLLPGDSPKFLMYTTLAGGLATQRLSPATNLLAEPWAMIGPWTAIAVTLVYAAVGVGLAWWRIRTRDV